MDEFLINSDLNLYFQKHLELTDNKRILFSAPYGVGKSTFLRDFFEKKAEYNVIHLYPVNYSISSNEDIIDLLKHDIIYELCTKFNISTDNPEFTQTELISWFAHNKSPEVLKQFIELIPHVGKPLSGLFSLLTNLNKEYEKFTEGVNKGEISAIKELIEQLGKNRNTGYYNDFYIDFISRKLEEIKGTPEKKNVLIIDDLDRVDPEHLFRLFNVFSAHFDINKDENTNKFGFDTIIFVCDENNIKEIFHHKFGIKVDFNGYIDKFYSIEIFSFDNRILIDAWLKKQHKSIPISGKYLKIQFAADIINAMVKSNTINFRKILNFKDTQIHEKIYSIDKIERYNDARSFDFSDVVMILIMVCGTVEGLIKVLRDCKLYFNSKGEYKLIKGSNTYKYLKEFILPVILARQESYSEGSFQGDLKSFTKINQSIVLNYVLKFSDYKWSLTALSEFNIEHGKFIEKMDIQIWGLLIEAVESLKADEFIS